MSNCTRCGGTFYTRAGIDGKETSCMNCGYDPTFIVSPDILAEVEASLGKKTVKATFPRFNIRDNLS